MIEYNKFIKRMLQTQVLKSFPPIKKPHIHVLPK